MYLTAKYYTGHHAMHRIKATDQYRIGNKSNFSGFLLIVNRAALIGTLDHPRLGRPRRRATKPTFRMS